MESDDRGLGRERWLFFCYRSYLLYCCYGVARCFIVHSAIYSLLSATKNKLFLVIFTRELQNSERIIKVTYMTTTRLVGT